MAVSQRTLQAIKAAPISKVIEALGAPMKRVGREYLTQCLWHEDKNPSLTVSDDKGFSFCHVCRGGGDAIDYVSKRLGLGWRDAAEKVASLLSIPFELDDEDPVASARKKEALERARAALEQEQSTYKINIRDPRAGRIRDFLAARGLTPEASKEFGIGYAPDGFFAQRITVPIYDHRNHLVGFTGRTTVDAPAKYKNSQDSDVFQKKLLVFNEVRAKEAAREAGCLVVVEGHLDVVSMWQAGIRNVVAMQGTGAPDQNVLQRLTRSCKNVILCFDGDAGGKKATEQFISVGGKLAMKGELNISVVSLPEGSDPDDVIRSGGDLYSMIANAPSWIDWLIDTWAAALDRDDAAMITEVETKLRGLIDGLRSKALRAHYIQRAAQVLGTSQKESDSIVKSWGSAVEYSEARAWTPRTPQQARVAAEIRLVRLYIHRPEMRPQLREMMMNVTHPPLMWLCQRLIELRQHCNVDLTPYSVAAIVAVAEPHFMQQLRTIVKPNVNLDDSEGVVNHLRGIMGEDIDFAPDA